MNTSTQSYSLSIVIPVYNGAATITPLAERLIASLDSSRLQIVLVNDGSPDNSHKVCLNLAERYRAVVTYISLSRNFSEHNAVMAGLNYVRGDYTVIMDDDFQNPPEEVHKLVEAVIAGGYDVVYSHYKRKRHNIFRNLGSQFNNWVASLMLDKPLNLYLSSFKCLNRFIVSEVIKYHGPFPYIDGLILRCTRNIGIVEVEHRQREEGSSGYTLRKLIGLWMNMFINFSINPLRLSSLLGFFFSCLGVLLSVMIIVEKMLNPGIPVGWPSLIIAIMLLSGVQLLILGLLGEYLGRLFLSNNQTPQFVIRDVFPNDPK